MGTVLLFLIVLVLCVWYEAPASLSRFLPSEKRFSLIGWVARSSLARFVSSAKLYMGIRLSYEHDAGLALPERFVLVANHQSLLDIPVLMDYLRGRRTLLFVAKKELGMGIPMISSVLKIQGHALVERSGSAAQSMKRLASFSRHCARRNYCPALFPEGTRSKNGCLGRFHSAGLRKILEHEPLPVVVVALDGGYAMATLRRVFQAGVRREYRVKALAVLYPGQDKKAVVDCLDTARGLIAAQLESWRSRA